MLLTDFLANLQNYLVFFYNQPLSMVASLKCDKAASFFVPSVLMAFFVD